MAHAIFNVSPVKFLSSIQDHVFTVTPTFKNKSYSNKSDKRQSFQQQEEQQQRSSSSASPITLQLTLAATEQIPQMTEIPQQTNYKAQPRQQQQTLSPSAVPIDIPRSYPLNVPNNGFGGNSSRAAAMDYEGLLMSNNLLSTSYNSHQSFSYNQQENNLISLANSISAQSPYLPAEDLTVHFDGLAVRSPTGSIYSNGALYSPQQINSPIHIGSPHHPFGSPTSPIYLNGGCSPQQNNFLAQSPSYVGTSPNSPSHFLGSPIMTPTFNELGLDINGDLSSSYGGFTYLSPSLQPQQQQQQLSPLNSPSPTGSYANNLYLFPPNSTTRPTSPVPDDVILTASEVNDYINSPPYLSTSHTSTSFLVQQQQQQDIGMNGTGNISDLLFGIGSSDNSDISSPINTTTALDDMELFPNNSTTTTTSIVTPSSPQQQYTTQPQFISNTAALFFSEDDLEEEDEDDDGIIEDILNNSQHISVPKNRKNTTNTTTPSGRRAKIHKCPYCNHTSNRANNMREHTLIHNPNRPKPHACKLCNRAFARKHDMNRHYISCKKQHSKSGAIMTSPSLEPTI